MIVVRNGQESSNCWQEILGKAWKLANTLKFSTTSNASEVDKLCSIYIFDD